MDEQLNQTPENNEMPKQEPYHPRPTWQIVLAWVGIAVVLGAFLLYLYQIATGGL